MKIDINSNEPKEWIIAENVVKSAIKKFKSVKQREEFLKNLGYNVKFSYLRDYVGLGNHLDYIFKKRSNNTYVERRIIVGRPYNSFDRHSRCAICLILKVNINKC